MGERRLMIFMFIDPERIEQRARGARCSGSVIGCRVVLERHADQPCLSGMADRFWSRSGVCCAASERPEASNPSAQSRRGYNNRLMKCGRIHCGYAQYDHLWRGREASFAQVLKGSCWNLFSNQNARQATDPVGSSPSLCIAITHSPRIGGVTGSLQSPTYPANL